MPPKKKKGKGSKLTRMSDEEKLRYLQHRAEIELEAKRRKQQLIAVFTKNKLKREEAFSRLNTAKINEQWRFILRQVKCKELYNDLQYLWSNFDKTLRAKDALIDKLMKELENSNRDHKRLQESHMEMIDKLISRHIKQLSSMQDNYLKAVMDIKRNRLSKMNLIKDKLEQECWNFESIIYAQSFTIESKLMETSTRNAINTYYIEHSKEEAIEKIRWSLGGKIHDLWSTLLKTVVDYQSSTSAKKKQYDILKESDDAHRHEAAQYPKLESHLQSTIEMIKDQESKLNESSSNTILQLNNQHELLINSIKKLKQEIRMNQTMDEINLKKLTVMSGQAIRELTKIKLKSLTILTLFKSCSTLAAPSGSLSSVKKYKQPWESPENHPDSINDRKSTMLSPYDLLENFWEQYNYVKVENIFKRKEKNELIIENKKLRVSLQTYLITVARMPVSRPQTSTVDIKYNK